MISVSMFRDKDVRVNMPPAALKNLVRTMLVTGFVEAEDDVPAVKLRKPWYIIGAHKKFVRLEMILPSLIVAPFGTKIRNVHPLSILPVLMCGHINGFLSNDDGIGLVFGKPDNLNDLGGCTIADS